MTGWDARMVMDDADRDPFRKEALSSNTTDCTKPRETSSDWYGSDLATTATFGCVADFATDFMAVPPDDFVAVPDDFAKVADFVAAPDDSDLAGTWHRRAS